uniref:Down syndrome cell adhesion molecule-like protein Dscam2 n=1 Tax=Cacopsylla melanoneura TaxID=428564 RepID=A0A8D8VVZ6_9HEMI
MPCFNVLGFVLFAALFSRWTNFPALFVLGDSYAGPSFLREPPSHVDFANDTGATLDCSAEGTEPVTISWVTAADNRPVSPIHGVLELLLNGSLLLLPFHASDYRHDVHAATYRCVASNTVGKLVSRDVRVNAVVLQNHELHVEASKDVQIGASAMLRCNTPGFVREFISVTSWIQDSTFNIYPSPRGDGKYHMLASGELIIHQVDESDRYRSYQCRGVNKLTGASLLSVNRGRISLAENMRMLSAAKMFEKHRIINVKKDDSVILPCSAQGNPHPTIKWYKQDSPVEESERIQRIGSCLFISHVEETDSGLWNCVGNNSEGQDKMQLFIQVKSSLSIEMSPSGQVVVDVGHRIELHCRVSPKRLASAKAWLKDGLVLRRNSEEVLVLDRVQREDAGMYQCHVSADDDSAQMSAQVILGASHPQLIYKFIQQTLQPGPPVSLKCIATGNPTPHISWKLDGYPLAGDRFVMGQYMSLHGDVISHVNISSVRVEDSGIYQCTATNRVGSQTHSADMRVYGAPFVRAMGNVSAIAGEPLYLGCPVAGYPIESIFWEREGRTLPINRKQKVFPNGTLIIENVERLSDQATYTCVAKNAQGYSSRGTLEVQVMDIPLMLPLTISAQNVSQGDYVQLTCVVSKGDHPIFFSWYLNGVRIDENTQSAAAVNVGRQTSLLMLHSVTFTNAGNYTCDAANPAGRTAQTASLSVTVPPRWILEPSDKAFAQGSDAKMECKADGFPKPQVTWKKAPGNSPGDYKDLRPNNPDVKVEDGTLYLNNIQKNNQGYYLCEAVNGIGSGLSAVITVSVQAPPEFEIKLRNQTSRRGEPSVLQCEAKGEKPIGILWNMNNKRLDPKSDNRYTIREEILTNGVLSDLSIKRTERGDSALFTCVATNAFGSDDSSINLIVQEVPEVPYGLKVLDKSGRTVQLSWVAPYDGNSLIKRYIIEYKISKGTWEKDIDRVLVPGEQTLAGVFNLRPAQTYHIRIVGENEIGSSEPSDTVTILTAEEAPSGPPTHVKVEATDQNTLKVSWKPPEREEWNGVIQGYYVGYKETSTDKPFLFETVDFSKEEGKEHHLTLSSLKTYTQYSVVVQALNKLGAGPTSEEVKQYTAEGTPDQPPQDNTCTTLTSQTIRVSWVSPPLITANGVIKGYKVVYGPSDTWYDENTKDTKITPSSETILHGLKKFTNYSMQILAFTSGGDGVKSAPIHCQTEQDVPEPPAAIKALVMSGESILVSWKPPLQPNGQVIQYTVYVKEEPKDDTSTATPEIKSQKISPLQMSYEASGLKKKQNYIFYVTASTNIGEGQPSKSVTLSPSNRVPAKIASFDDKFTATYREDIKLPCLTVGVPNPEIVWKVKGVKFESNDRMRQLPEGSLFIKTVTRSDAGEYSCSVENSFGVDTVTHQLIVHAPPHLPQVQLTTTTTNSITMKLKPHPNDKEPIHGYTVRYKPEFGDWDTVQVPATAQKYTVENLWCGSRYQISVTAYNGIGTGDESETLNTKTKGSKPIIPDASRFIEVSSNSITLHMMAWSDGGCPMLYFVVENKKKTHTEWNQVSNNVKPGGNFVVLDLDPATWYNLRVTAHNNAGFSVAEYEFATLTITGGTVAPSIITFGSADDTFKVLLANLNLVVPAASAIVVIIVAFIVICFLRGKDSDQKDDIVYNQSMVGAMNTVDKRHINEELGYIAPPNRKLPPVPGSNYNTCDRIKRGTSIRPPGSFRSHCTWDPRGRHMYEELESQGYTGPRGRLPPCPGSDETLYTRHRNGGMEDEICPYATFHLLGFREEMDPAAKAAAMNFQTFPHQNGHTGTLGHTGSPNMQNGHLHQRSGSQSMPRNGGRYSTLRSGPNSIYAGPEYDDPANCQEDPYEPYGAPYDHYGSRNSVGRRSFGSSRNIPTSNSPEPPPPPPRNHDPNSSGSANDSKESNEISEAECDRDQLVTRNYAETKSEDTNTKTEVSQPTILWQCNL